MSSRQHDRIGRLLEETIGVPRLSPEQRRRHRERLGTAAAGLDRQDRRAGWRNAVEFGFVSAVALIVIVAAVLVFANRDEAPGDERIRGVSPDAVIAAAQPLEPGDARYARFRIQADIRRDQGLTLVWIVERWERVTADGTEQERVVAYDADGRQIASFTRSGDAWIWMQYGWVESGSPGLGIANLPESIEAARVEPQTVAEYLAQPRASDEIELVRDRRGEATRYRFTNPEALAWTRSEFGIEAATAVYEIVRDPERGGILETSVYLVTVENEEITLGRYEFLDIESLGADALDDALFEVADTPDQTLQYAPSEGDLPLGLAVVRHYREFMGGSENLVLESADLEFALHVAPSTGGFDPRALEATRAPDVVVRRTDSAAGPIVWIEQRETGAPWVAYWDDGRYRFRLSISNDPPGDLWSEEALKRLVEALSS